MAGIYCETERVVYIKICMRIDQAEKLSLLLNQVGVSEMDDTWKDIARSLSDKLKDVGVKI